MKATNSDWIPHCLQTLWIPQIDPQGLRPLDHDSNDISGLLNQPEMPLMMGLPANSLWPNSVVRRLDTPQPLETSPQTPLTLRCHPNWPLIHMILPRHEFLYYILRSLSTSIKIPEFWKVGAVCLMVRSSNPARNQANFGWSKNQDHADAIRSWSKVKIQI
jgi:hypothetical protein